MWKCPQQLRHTSEFRGGAGHTENYYVLTCRKIIPNWRENLVQEIAKATSQLRQNSVTVGKEQPIFNFDWSEVEFSKSSAIELTKLAKLKKSQRKRWEIVRTNFTAKECHIKNLLSKHFMERQKNSWSFRAVVNRIDKRI